MKLEKQTDLINVWNVHEGIPVYTEAQTIFNVVGNLSDISGVSSLSYELNDGPSTPVFFKQPKVLANRLERIGDFNIDTVDVKQLNDQNRLSIKAQLTNGEEVLKTINFPKRPIEANEHLFRLDCTDKSFPEEVGQVVDGQWQIKTAPDGNRCLELESKHTGLDRIILLTNNQLTTGYRIFTRLNIIAWTGSPFNVGLVYKWNPHLQGDGSQLPSQWTTGLGYYYSHCPGLRIRTGVDVHLNDRGEKLGDYIMAEKPFSPWRYWASQVLKKARIIKHPLPQIIPGIDYCFELVIGNDIETLTVWKMDCMKPQPQIVVHNPPNLLPFGAAGIIAHRCGLRVYDFDVVSI